jgi:hypothetical protein
LCTHVRGYFVDLGGRGDPAEQGREDRPVAGDWTVVDTDQTQADSTDRVAPRRERDACGNSHDRFCAATSCQLFEAPALARLRHIQTKTCDYLFGTKGRPQVPNEELLRVDHANPCWTASENFASERQCDRGEL